MAAMMVLLRPLTVEVSPRSVMVSWLSVSSVLSEMTMLLPLSLYAEIRMKDGIGEGVTVAKGSDSFSLHGEEWHQVWLDLEHLFKLITPSFILLW